MGIAEFQCLIHPVWGASATALQGFDRDKFTQIIINKINISLHGGRNSTFVKGTQKRREKSA